MFTDRVKIECRAGNGGDGIVAWRRAKFLPKGGPWGGDGGDGGSIFLYVSNEITSLEWFRNRRLLRAQNGRPGGPKCCKGKRGKDLILKVPCGTLVKDLNSGEILFDLTQENQQVMLCKGGKAGYGNDHFKSPTHQAPNICTKGKKGKIYHIELELKLIADVGLVGFPNSGKSTLLNTFANVDVKVAAYPFTTLTPNLSYIELLDYRRVFIADIPGIVENAHQNRGLGLEFLRHIERTRVLLFVLDASHDPALDFAILRKEIATYQQQLSQRSFLVALNKSDIEGTDNKIEEFYQSKLCDPSLVYPISALNKEGIGDLVKALEKALDNC